MRASGIPGWTYHWTQPVGGPAGELEAYTLHQNESQSASQILLEHLTACLLVFLPFLAPSQLHGQQVGAPVQLDGLGQRH